MRDRGDVTGLVPIAVSVAGAWISATPFVVVSETSITSGVKEVGAVVAALTAIAVGVGLLWNRLRRLVLGVEKLVGADARLTYLEQCMEAVLDHLGIEPPDRDKEES